MTAAKPVLWSQRARRDLRTVGDFIARDKPGAAARWVARILDSADRLSVFPGSGRVVPEIGRDDVREVILFNYRVVYQIRRNDVVIVTVFEGHRRLPDLTNVKRDAG